MAVLPRSLALRISSEGKGVTVVPSNMKYAHVERERRYLHKGPSPELRPTRVLRIQDKYVINSSLRLRRVDEDGRVPVFKLGQKKRFGDDSPLRIAHTTLYISKSEFELLATLPADSLEKHRSVIDLGNWQFALDVFGGELAGLVLVEVNLGPYGEAHPTLPLQELEEVTLDERFTGGKLASTSRADLQSVLSEYGVN